MTPINKECSLQILTTRWALCQRICNLNLRGRSGFDIMLEDGIASSSGNLL